MRNRIGGISGKADERVHVRFVSYYQFSNLLYRCRILDDRGPLREMEAQVFRGICPDFRDKRSFSYYRHLGLVVYPCLWPGDRLPEPRLRGDDNIT